MADELPILSFLGIRDVGVDEPGTFVVECHPTNQVLNRHDMVHGAAVAALVDHAGGVGARVLTGQPCLTADLHVRFLGPATDRRVLRAAARVERAGRTFVVMGVRVTDDAGRLVAVGDLALVPVDPAAAADESG